MKNNNVKFGIIVLVSCLIPIASQAIFGASPYMESPGMFYFFWGIINFLFLTTVIELSGNYIKVFSLKNLKTNKPTFFVNVFVYLAFLIFVNLYFVQQLYFRDNTVLNRLTHINILMMLFILFIINLNCGQFPESDETENNNTTIYSIRKKGPFKFGKERFGTVIGSYDKGIVIGADPFSYEDIKTVYEDQKNSGLVIKGKNEDGNFRVSIEAPKSKEAAIKILKEASKNSLIEKEKINL